MKLLPCALLLCVALGHTAPSALADSPPRPTRILVLGPDGRPLEGAQLVLATAGLGGYPICDPRATPIALSGPNGRLDVVKGQRLPAGRLVVRAEGLAPVLVPAVREAVALRLMAGEALSGRIRLAGGAPAVRRQVLALPTGGHADLAHLAQTDVAGRYRFPTLHQGEWRLFLAHAKGRLQRLGTFRAGMHLGDTRIAFTSSIRGQVLDADGTRRAAAAGVALRFTPMQGGGGDGSAPITIETDEQGWFLIGGLEAGVYTVALNDPVWMFDQRAPRIQAEVGRAREIPAWFAIRRRGVTGRVLDVDGKPVRGVLVGLMPDAARPAPPGGYGPQQRPVYTDPEGRYRLKHVTPAEGYRILLSGRGFSPWSSFSFRVDRGRDTKLKDVRLRRGWAVDVRVRDEDGKPLAGVEVSATAAATPNAFNDERWAGVVRRGLTNTEGRVRLADLPADDVVCHARLEGHELATDVVSYPRVSNSRRLEMTLRQSASLTGQLLTNEGDFTGPFHIRAVRRDGGGVVEVATQEKLRFRFPTLADTATDFFVLASDAEDADVLARVENVVPGVEQHLEILLPRLLALRGTVRDLDRDADPGWVVVETRRYDPGNERYIWHVVRRLRLKAERLGTLSFEVVGLPPGFYTVRAVQGSLDSGAEALLLDREDIEQIELTLPAGARLAGSLLDEEGLPLLGAVVSLTRLHGADEAHLLADGPLQRATDERGDFVFEGISPGLWKLRAEDEERTPTETTVRLQEGEVLVLEDLSLIAGGTLKGLVEDGEGRALDGAHVRVSFFASGERERLVRTDPEGRYEVRHLRPGAYRVRVAATAVSGGPKIEAIVEVVAGEVTQADFSAEEEAAIAGTVLRQGQPVPGALVDVVHEPFDTSAPLRRYRTSTQGDGTFEIDHLPPGHVRIQLQSGAWRSERALVLEAGDRLQLDLEAFAARLRGLVVTRLGDAVPDAQVQAHPLDEQGSPIANSLFVAEGRTDPSGRFVLRGLPVGTYRVTVSGAGLPPGRYEAAEADLPGADYEFEVVLGRGGDINLHLRDEKERGVTGAQVWLEDAAGRALNQHAYVTGAAGRLRIEGVPPGAVSLRVYARGKGRPAARTVRVVEGRQTDVAMRLMPAGAVQLVVTGEGADPVGRTRIDLLRPGSRELIASRRPLSPIRLAAPWGHVPRSGIVTLSDLEAGPYLAVISAGRAYQQAEILIEVKTGTTSVVEVRLLLREDR